MLPNSLQYIDTACLYSVSSILKTGSTWKPKGLRLRFYHSNSLKLICSPLHLHFRTLKHLLITLVFIRSNWQNYHRFLLESLRPLNIIYNISIDLLLCPRGFKGSVNISESCDFRSQFDPLYLIL